MPDLQLMRIHHRWRTRRRKAKKRLALHLIDTILMVTVQISALSFSGKKGDILGFDFFKEF